MEKWVLILLLHTSGRIWCSLISTDTEVSDFSHFCYQCIHHVHEGDTSLLFALSLADPSIISALRCQQHEADFLLHRVLWPDMLICGLHTLSSPNCQSSDSGLPAKVIQWLRFSSPVPVDCISGYGHPIKLVPRDLGLISSSPDHACGCT
ncbi:hypothetical protein JB92DRAFT_2937750 [Gautieria morchelliformis]|nr:hypothetical protein JB92DRAFT_2937750 [Gautieria morchelliformis]